MHDQAALFAGDTWFIAGTLHDETNAILDLSAAAVQWRLKDQTGNYVLDLSIGNGIAIVDAAAGTVKITVTPQQSALPPGVYFDQCRVTLADGSVSTQWTATITVKQSFFVS